MGASVLNRDGKEITPIMGCYGIGIERILTAAIESAPPQFRPQRRRYLRAATRPSRPSRSSSPSPTSAKPALLEAGEKIAAELDAAGVDVLLDDRDERAGVKFKDADLIGIPYRINIGKKLAEGKVELVDRLTNTTTDVPIDAEAVQRPQLAPTSNTVQLRHCTSYV